MTREFIEEAGVEYKDWKKFCVLEGPKRWVNQDGPTVYGWDDVPEFRVHFFCAFDDFAHQMASTIEDEEIIHCPVVDALNGRYNLMSNLYWLLPMTQTYMNQSVDHYVVQEVR
jgi:hypothetical protein